MRVPIRKSGNYIQIKSDPYITRAKFDELKSQLEKLTKFTRPRLAEEVQRLAEMGDFSENAAYQMAKGRLRGVNQKILDLENQLSHAEIIETNQDKDTVRVGHSVTLEINGKSKIYQILGSTETNPSAGVISRHSPLGKALLDKSVGDVVKITLSTGIAEYKIVEIK